jgi:uncharacterized protein
MRAMKRLGNHLLHTLLILTERPGQWAAWQVAPVPLALAGTAGLLWFKATSEATWGWAVGLSLLVAAVVDWGLLASLPRDHLSFGPIQPPWLGLVLLRWLVALAAVPLAGQGPLPVLAGLSGLQALLWALIAYGTRIEPFRVQVSHIQVPHAKLANPGKPLRIVQLSDLHVERLTHRERSLPALVSGLAPDLIVLTGDFLNTSYQRDPKARAELASLLAGLSAPGGVYAVWGTPEVDLPDFLRPTLTELGIVVVEDRAIELQIEEHGLWLVGLSCTRDLDAAAARLRRLLAQAPADAFSILLYHTPDLMPQAAALGVDLYLAGHTHGGQWRLPGFGALVTSSRYGKRYEAGHYQEANTQLYVSRGLGMEGFGAPRARFFCPPEVVEVTLTAPRQGANDG